MKNLLKICLFSIFFLVCGSVLADEYDFSIKVHDKSTKFFRFSVLKAEDVHLALISNSNETIYEEDIHTDGAKSKVYDLNALPNGNYSLEISSYTKSVKYKIVIQNNSIIVSDPYTPTEFKPTLTKLENKIVLDVNNLEEAPIEVWVFDENNECIYKQVFLDRKKLSTVFNISKTDLPSLTFVVTVKDRNFTETVNL